MSLKSKFLKWYKGGPLPTKEVNSPTSTTHRMPNTFEPSTSALFAQWVVKNIIGILTIIVGATVALFIHFDGNSAEPPAYHEKINSISNAITGHNEKASTIK